MNRAGFFRTALLAPLAAALAPVLGRRQPDEQLVLGSIGAVRSHSVDKGAHETEFERFNARVKRWSQDANGTYRIEYEDGVVLKSADNINWTLDA